MRSKTSQMVEVIHRVVLSHDAKGFETIKKINHAIMASHDRSLFIKTVSRLN